MNDMNKQIHYVLYHSDETDVSVNAVIQNDSIWVTQKAMADLFSVNTPAISKHLKNIYEEGELSEESTVSKMEIVQTEGSRQVKRNAYFYNLDAIISVGYRVNSRQATKFMISAKQAKEKAESEYDEFNKTQKITSDFDKAVQKMLESKGGKHNA